LSKRGGGVKMLAKFLFRLVKVSKIARKKKQVGLIEI